MTTDQPRAVVDRFNVGVEQGYLENSNVNAMREITQLIEVNRAFESVSSLMRDSEDPSRKPSRHLGAAANACRPKVSGGFGRTTCTRTKTKNTLHAASCTRRILGRKLKHEHHATV